jgi:adenosine deaminase CECR1
VLIRIAVVFLLTVPFGLKADWFEDFKQSASDSELHQLLYEMPKGGDLHLHLSGSGFPHWWLELAIDSEAQGYRYLTKTHINNCRGYDEAGFTQYLIHYQTIAEWRWRQLDECERAEFLPLTELSQQQRQAWMNAIMLDAPHEGRDELFNFHWQRLGDMLANPYITSGLLLRNMQAFADEGLLYIEPQVTPYGYADPEGTPIPSEQVAGILREHLSRKSFTRTGVEVRFQIDLLRFLPDTEEQIEQAYAFVSANDHWVAINMVGREDNDKGYPLRFLDTYRAMRRQYNDVRLSIHAGEVDEPNHHVRDTILLGAERIGHGINLITDAQTMRTMRHGSIMVEIGLISNRLLDYVDDFQDHPFPEYLRTGIPVALSTDDRGMWDSTMTDEFFVAVKEYNLSWQEIRQLSENSLRFAFVDDATRTRLLETYRSAIEKFEKKMSRKGPGAQGDRVSPRLGFVCREYALCPAGSVTGSTL